MICLMGLESEVNYFMTEDEQQLDSYLEELGERESVYRENGETEKANEVLRIMNELAQILGYI